MDINIPVTYVATTHDSNIIANIHVNFCYLTMFKDYVTGLEVLAMLFTIATICSKVTS